MPWRTADAEYERLGSVDVAGEALHAAVLCHSAHRRQTILGQTLACVCFSREGLGFRTCHRN